MSNSVVNKVSRPRSYTPEVGDIFSDADGNLYILATSDDALDGPWFAVSLNLGTPWSDDALDSRTADGAVVGLNFIGRNLTITVSGNGLS